MAQELAELKAHVSMRPWRVGVLVDTTSVPAVRDVIADLSGVWGGIYMPIFDVNAPVDELERLGNLQDVDALYADTDEGSVGELLRKAGWSWGGRGPYGPFKEEHGFRRGLLPAYEFLESLKGFAQPVWEAHESYELLFAATWGIVDRFAPAVGGLDSDAGAGVGTHLKLDDFLAGWRPDLEIRGALDATRRNVNVKGRAHLEGAGGVYIVRQDHPQDVVEFWNRRTYGTRVIGLPAACGGSLFRHLTAGPLPAVERRRGGPDAEVERGLTVWGLSDASAETRTALKELADAAGLKLCGEDRGEGLHFPFPGVETPFTRSIRTEFRPTVTWTEVPLPPIPLQANPDRYQHGTVAADVRVQSVSGQDPRLTTMLPPYRRLSALAQRYALQDGTDQARVTLEGVALLVQADREQAPIPFPYNLDAMQLLFDDDAVKVEQSEIGKFQSRAAEKFGGTFGGVFTQPGLRAAVEETGSKTAGIALQHLRNLVERHSGAWPDPLYGRGRVDKKTYAQQVVNSLLGSGLLIPMLKVHCSHCRVDRQVTADEVATTMECEFCGESFKLALSLSLANEGWRYRLASHLGPEKIRALLPALAAAGVLRQLNNHESATAPHVLGLEVTVDGRKIEVDLAVYMRGNNWVVVLGEVKNRNRIDSTDIGNLEFLQGKLRAAGVTAIIMIATLKDRLVPEEVALLRGLAERAEPVVTPQGVVHPLVPLVLTGPDLSWPWGSEKAPWRWPDARYHGIHGTPLASCRRNLGLLNFRFEGRTRPGSPMQQFEWVDDLAELPPSAAAKGQHD